MLLKLQKQIQYYAETISTVTGLDVDVVDTDLIRIAGTGRCAKGIGESIKNAGNLLKTTLKGSKPLFIVNPRESEICKGCQTKADCHELLSVCAPISDGKTTFGAIDLICFSQEARERVLSQRAIYLNFLSLLAISIAARVNERQEFEDISDLLDIMSQVVNTNNKGTLIYDAKGSIVYHNERAKEILHKTLPSQFENFSITPTGCTFSDLNEYTVEQENRQQLIVGKYVEPKSAASRFSKVFVFDTIQSVISHSPQGSAPSFDSSLDNIIGQSPLLLQLKEQITATGNTRSSVLITGESGTGKELVARAIHAIGDRADAPFIAINCGAIPDTLLESELFGYVGGAFTGALSKGQIGKFELAEGGVLFLDEIGSMPLYLQVKLLRVLQERTITRLGATRPVSVDIRVIAACNDNLQELMAQNMFRSDLYYRLNVIPLHTPPLRRRLGDLDLLVDHFISKYCTLFGKKRFTLPAPIVQKMRDYDWPGNIRELENTIEYLVNIVSDQGEINQSTLHAGFLQNENLSPKTPPEPDAQQPVIPLKTLEHQAIMRALAYYGDTTKGKKQAAKALGVSLATLYRKIEK
ncbi:sigma-54 interaction domain-containing protein [Desulfoluna spongiiphila]|uniref:Transcriptional regulator containing PAS, AAA-type ATPase, and DNA-binding Fis domains n=1 Tax=Desulfoluna spongiiphila TaxID=419481 RepID=A0A1G5JAT0_9BACT|nr:sigma 54-interacting transcriptional regulator [Desulfoluna spongiiphila]SCY85466.1 Transcriptional regulator containing PAS, AAA-type ATPase, and DNA-binding Fis domains [Desulfoluna spongiiphila]